MMYGLASILKDMGYGVVTNTVWTGPVASENGRKEYFIDFESEKGIFSGSVTIDDCLNVEVKGEITKNEGYKSLRQYMKKNYGRAW